MGVLLTVVLGLPIAIASGRLLGVVRGAPSEPASSS
jgi:hypothetical protein